MKELTKSEMVKIIKQYERSSGYTICNICNNLIAKGKRIVINREEINPYRTYIIGAVCLDCYNVIMKRNFGDEK